MVHFINLHLTAPGRGEQGIVVICPYPAALSSR